MNWSLVTSSPASTAGATVLRRFHNHIAHLTAVAYPLQNINAVNPDNRFNPSAEPLKLFSIVVPARDEEESLPAMVEHLHLELTLNHVPHEIVVVDDGSKDRTWEVLQQLKAKLPVLRPVQNTGDHGFGRAVVSGLRHSQGDAAAIMMADESDDARDAVRYWKLLNEGWDCVLWQPVHQGRRGD